MPPRTRAVVPHVVSAAARVPSVAAAVTVVVAVAACGRRGPASAPSATSPTVAPRVDHVIVAIDSLERGIALLRRATGVTAVVGGVHPGRGTRNALIGLGPGTYLELLAPNPADTTPGGRAGAAGFAGYRTLTPVGWAVRVDDAAAERGRLVARGLAAGALRPGARQRLDGGALRWTTFDPWGAERDVLPFVIAWGAGGPHPSDDAPAGCTLARFALVSAAADSLRARFAGAGWAVAVHAGPVERLELALSCPTGTVRLPAER